MRLRFFYFAIAVLFLFSKVDAQTIYSDYASIGPRITYNFGEGGGWKFGFEAAYFPRVSSDAKFAYGLTMDILFQSSYAYTVHSASNRLQALGSILGRASRS